VTDKKQTIILVSDADNTLWDTDAVYANAQLALLAAVEEATGTRAAGEDRLAFIREIDQELALEHHQHLRYPPPLLVTALGLALSGTSSAQAAKRAVRAPLTTPKTIDPDRLAERFIAQIRTEIPALRVGVLKGLQNLHGVGVSITVATEGPEEKCRRMIEHHGLVEMVARIVSAPKTAEFFGRVARLMGAGEALCFSVGDQLDRDIAPAKQAGYKTIYFPGGFKPSWTPEEKSIAPDYRISSFEEIAPIIEHGAGGGNTNNHFDRAAKT
jgi:putative hydrolase of the HAD superfamily